MQQRQDRYAKKPPSRVDVGTLAWYGYNSVEEVMHLDLLTPEARDFMEQCGWDFEQGRERDGTNG